MFAACRAASGRRTYALLALSPSCGSRRLSGKGGSKRAKKRRLRHGEAPMPPPPPKVTGTSLDDMPELRGKKSRPLQGGATKAQVNPKQQRPIGIPISAAKAQAMETQREMREKFGLDEEPKATWHDLVRLVRTQDKEKHKKLESEQEEKGFDHGDLPELDREFIEEEEFFKNYYDPEAPLIPVEEHRWVWTLPGFGEPIKPGSKTIADSRKLFSGGFTYLGNGVSCEQVAKLNPDAPEVAIIGRSNVGKSSLMNALLGVKNPHAEGGAIVSNKQGRTRQIHAFGLGRNPGLARSKIRSEYRLVLTDLPGYGYAAVSTEAVKDLSKIIFEYLTNRERKRLVHAFLLLDGRAGITPNDFQMMRMLEVVNLEYTCVLTKCDRLSEEGVDKVARHVTETLAQRGHARSFPRVFGLTTKPQLMRIGDTDKYTMVKDGNIDRLRAELLMQVDRNVSPHLLDDRVEI